MLGQLWQGRMLGQLWYGRMLGQLWQGRMLGQLWMLSRAPFLAHQEERHQEELELVVDL